MLCSNTLLIYAGTFTTNVVAAAPVLYCKDALEKSETVCYYNPVYVGCRGSPTVILAYRQQFSYLSLKLSNSICIFQLMKS